MTVLIISVNIQQYVRISDIFIIISLFIMIIIKPLEF